MIYDISLAIIMYLIIFPISPVLNVYDLMMEVSNIYLRKLHLFVGFGITPIIFCQHSINKYPYSIISKVQQDIWRSAL